jgi:SulP family sulfate permease
VDLALPLRGGAGGFVFGLIVDQMPKTLGIWKEHGSYLDVLVGVVKDISDTSTSTLAVGVVSILALLAFRRFLPRLPPSPSWSPGSCCRTC